MTERGAQPNVPRTRRRILQAARALSTPLLPDDYLEMINPLWSTRELRGRVESVDHETKDAVTVTIRPGYDWMGHKPGQYIRIGFDIDGVRHWRAYSLTSDPDRPDGFISITPKLVEEGKVSPYVVRQLRPGTIVHLGEVEGQFILPDPPPEKLLFISAGSGVTPIMSMVRHLDQERAIKDAVLLHSARTEDDVIFGEQLRDIAKRNDNFHLHEQYTGIHGRIGPEDLDDLCSDWRDREAFLSGPGSMLDAMVEHWEKDGDCDRLHLERFQPIISGTGEAEGGTIKFLASDAEAESDGTDPILVAGENAGLELPFGCRMGICHTCVGTLSSGRVRDLRSGQIEGEEGDTIRTCISAPEGAIEIDL